MLALGWLLAFLAACLIVMVLPAVAWFEIRRAYSGQRRITCPETKAPADLELDAPLAARSRFRGHMQLRVAKCSRWPLGESCAEGCVPEALTMNRPDTFTINHVGVLAAALASSAVGDVLRCSPFAREWMAAAGYPALTFWERIAFRAPAVFDLAAMVVLAYVMTWLMRHVKFSGVLGGLEVAALVWLAVTCLSVPEVVFFFPVKIFAMSTLLKLASLLLQGLLLGIFVVPQPKTAAATAH